MMDLLLWMIQAVAILGSTIIAVLLAITLGAIIIAAGIGIYEGLKKGRDGK